MRTVFIGSGGFGLPTFRALAADPSIELVGAVTAPPRPAGRRLEPARTPITFASTALGVSPVLTPARLRDPAAVAEVLALDPSLIVLADYGRIVPRGAARAAGWRPQPPPIAPAAPSRRDAGPGHDPGRRRVDRREPHPDGRGGRHRPARGPDAHAGRPRRDRAGAGGASCRSGGRAAARLAGSRGSVAISRPSRSPRRARPSRSRSSARTGDSIPPGRPPSWSDRSAPTSRGPGRSSTRPAAD